jgi:hypothetical protein
VNFQEAVQNSSVVRGDHKDALLASLSKIPEFSWLVGQPNPHIDRLQGDFFNDFPALFLKPDGAVASKPRPVMVLNNTCDLPSGRSSMVSVAPLFDLEKYLQSQAGKRDAGSLANYERDIRHNRISELLFVPHLPGFTSGAIVRLDMVCSVAYSYLQEAINNNRRIASFTQSGFYLLLIKITYHFTRSESMEVSRT